MTDKVAKNIVQAGGGIWKGRMENLVLFDSPATGSTLAEYENHLTSQRVADKIAASNATFGVK